MHWRRKWQPTPVFLPGESQGCGSLVASIYGVAQSQTRLKQLSSSSSSSINQKIARVTILIRGRENFKSRKIIRNKEVHYIIIKGSILQENLTILNVYAQSLQSFLTLCDLVDYNLPGSSVHRIIQAWILEWVAISSSNKVSRNK